jgi:hypothetical protein
LFCLAAILFIPPHGDNRFVLPLTRQLAPHGNSFFSSLAAEPHGNYFYPASRRRLTAIIFIPPCGGASRQFFFSRLAAVPHGNSFYPPRGGASQRFFLSHLAVVPCGNSFSPALQRRLMAILFIPPHGGTSRRRLTAILFLPPCGGASQ